MSKTKALRRPSELITADLAANIREFRKKMNISQEEFADLCGLHRTYIGAVERCERNVTLSTLEAMASVMGVSASDLLKRQR